jgi:lipoprotein-anchoring transpeptidase ErfK/SrfK
MSSTPRKQKHSPLIIILTFAAIGVAACKAAPPPVAVSSTPGPPFALVKIAKPAGFPAASPIDPIPPAALPAETLTVVQTDPAPAKPLTIIPIDPAPTDTLTIAQTDPAPTDTLTIAQTDPAPTASPPPTEPPNDPQTSLISAVIVADTPPAPAPGYSNTTQSDAPPSYGGNKYILVDISEQHMYVYEGETQVYSFVSSTGMNNATRTGNFSVLDKIPSAYGATWDIWMPNWLGIYWAGSMENGIHALPILSNGGTLWAGYLGRPISYGCVVLGTYEAQMLYNWADIGTPVEIRW